ncbi:MAG: acyl carrier protein [Butyrivibrio sp.]|nr:acyl carrier protein [Butyrivibrio sp.]
MSETFKKIVAIIEDVADIPEEDIQEESNLIDDLDLSSLEIMSIISKIEKAFSIKMSEKELLSIENISDLVKYVDSL